MLLHPFKFNVISLFWFPMVFMRTLRRLMTLNSFSYIPLIVNMHKRFWLIMVRLNTLTPFTYMQTVFSFTSSHFEEFNYYKMTLILILSSKRVLRWNCQNVLNYWHNMICDVIYQNSQYFSDYHWAKLLAYVSFFAYLDCYSMTCDRYKLYAMI